MKRLVLLVVLWVVPASVQATEWHALAGVQSTNKGKQVIAFLPNEFWVHAGDSITWRFFSDEIHTVSFLTPGQIRPMYQAGCPGSGTTPDGSSFTGTACVNSGTLATGQSYTVNFPIVGNFKLVCLVHANMTAAIHVLDWSEVLPHDQAFYDREAQREAKELLLDGARLESRGVAAATRSSGDEDGDEHHHEHGATTTAVTAGISEVVATSGAGSHSVSVMRFMSDRSSSMSARRSSGRILVLWFSTPSRSALSRSIPRFRRPESPSIPMGRGTRLSMRRPTT
jgi:plastocyanin